MLTKTHLYQEIHEQPAVLQQVLAANRPVAEQLAQAIKQRGITQVVIAARGTSDNAGRYANYLLGAHNGLLVSLATPSLYTIYQQPPNLTNTLVLGISQSGKSPDIVAVLEEGQKQGALTAALTNFPNSPLAQKADFVLALYAGEEKSVAATKTYTSELAVVALLSACLAGEKKWLDPLAAVPQWVEDALRLNDDMARIAERYRYMSRCVVIGRGFNYATAFELALKMKELTYTMVEPYSSADFMHGPLALIEQGFPVVVVAPSGLILPELMGFMDTLKSRQAELLVISDHGPALDKGRVALPLPAGVPEWLSPLVSIIPGQLFAMNLAAAKDFHPDRPRNIQKVTETR
jgi:glucosamine--fructose-6-phosphate aminotransferase (isomerizing)